MTVTIYVWLTRRGHYGHASMRLGNGTYISLWPAENNTRKKKKRKKVENGTQEPLYERSESLAEDIYNEERSFDFRFDIEGLDERTMQRWWDNFHTKWSLLGQNCCKTVIDGLRVGGSERWLGFLGRCYYAVTLLWTPFRVKTYCSQMTKR